MKQWAKTTPQAMVIIDRPQEKLQALAHEEVEEDRRELMRENAKGNYVRKLGHSTTGIQWI